MQKTIKYTIFKTKWGYFGLAGSENALLRTHLPLRNLEKVKSRLLKMLFAVRESSIEYRESRIEFDKALFKTLQQQITAYFQSTYVDFNKDIPIVLDGLSLFANSVLSACRDIGHGQTTTYGRLAQKVGRPTCSRAVGRALAKNPLPLIIPCHRVVCANGKIGGFSASGGTNLKKRLLKHEQHRF